MRKLLLFVTLALFSLSANASDVYKFDPDHTNITWSANHFGFSNPSGKFTKSDGIIVLDMANPNRSKVEITIQTASLLTGLPKFDSYLKGKNFLNVSEFPTATFVSNKIITSGSKKAKVYGDLTLLGVTKPIVLHVKLNKIGINPFNKKRTAGFSALTVIKRSQFGMHFASPGVSDKVRIRIEAEGIFLRKTDSATSKSGDGSSKKSSNWEIVPSSSDIKFKANQSGSEINGFFKKFDGKVIFDPNNLADARIKMIVDTRSIAIGFGDSAAIIKGPEWLDTARFPQAIFIAKNFINITDNFYSASGKLKIKDTIRPATINFYLTKYSPEEGKASAKGSFTIKRGIFDIGDRDIKKANGVQDEIEIDFVLNAKK